jgi:hypothetical protein
LGEVPVHVLLDAAVLESTFNGVQYGDYGGKLGRFLLNFFNARSWMFPDTRVRGNAGAGGFGRNKNSSHLGNTALVYHHDRLLALMEGGFPILLKACRCARLALDGLCTAGCRLLWMLHRNDGLHLWRGEQALELVYHPGRNVTAIMQRARDSMHEGALWLQGLRRDARRLHVLRPAAALDDRAPQALPRHRRAALLQLHVRN